MPLPADPLGSSVSQYLVTPADGADLPQITLGLYVKTAGTLVTIGANDTASVDWGTVAAGAFLPIRAKRVLATGTTAVVIGLA